ncbi:DUF354 domain-containing protein [Methanocaldococcus infernus]
MIWIDLTNNPHVHFFSQIINFYRDRVFVTFREINNIRDIIKLYGFKAKCVGKHSTDLLGKLLNSSKRIYLLTKLIRNLNLKVAVAKHSVELPRVAFGLNIPTIFIVDNEQAEAQNRLTIPLVNILIKPIATDLEKFKNFCEVIEFDGVCEVANVNARLKIGLDENVKKYLDDEKYNIVLRPCPNSSYCNGHKDILPKIVEELNKRLDCHFIAFPRSKKQELIYKKIATVPEPLDSISLLHECDFMIGAGGTMNREAGVLGTPVVSCYPQELLGVDKYLIEKGRLYYSTNIKEIVSYVEDNIGKKLGLAKFEDPTHIIKEKILDYLQ